MNTNKTFKKLISFLAVFALIASTGMTGTICTVYADDTDSKLPAETAAVEEILAAESAEPETSATAVSEENDVPEDVAAAAETAQEVEDAVVIMAEEDTAEETTAEGKEEPAEEIKEAVSYEYEKDESGNLVLDENGKPVPVVPEGADIPVKYLVDEEGSLVLDENGNPVVAETVPEGSVILKTLEDKLNPDRSIDIYITWENGIAKIGETATLTAVLNGYENAVYTLQWQNSKDDINWNDIPDETERSLIVTTNEDNAYDYWRVNVIITDAQDVNAES